jgi:hypothetical protein
MAGDQFRGGGDDGVGSRQVEQLTRWTAWYRSLMHPRLGTAVMSGPPVCGN